MGQLHHLLQVDIAVKTIASPLEFQMLQVDTELVGKITSPRNTRYCKWILNYLEKSQVPQTPNIASGC